MAKYHVLTIKANNGVFKVYGGYVSAVHVANGLVKVLAITVPATNKKEAMGIARETALKSYPVSEGYSKHNFDVVVFKYGVR